MGSWRWTTQQQLGVEDPWGQQQIYHVNLPAPLNQVNQVMKSSALILANGFLLSRNVQVIITTNDNINTAFNHERLWNSSLIVNSHCFNVVPLIVVFSRYKVGRWQFTCRGSQVPICWSDYFGYIGSKYLMVLFSRWKIVGLPCYSLCLVNLFTLSACI